MVKKDTITVSVRLDRETHALLSAAAEKEHRSMANFIEVLIVTHCREAGVSIGVDPKQTAKKRP